MIMRKWWEKKPSAFDRYLDAMSEWQAASTRRADTATERLDMQWDQIQILHCRIDLLSALLADGGLVDSPTQMYEEWAG